MSKDNMPMPRPFEYQIENLWCDTCGAKALNCLCPQNSKHWSEEWDDSTQNDEESQSSNWAELPSCKECLTSDNVFCLECGSDAHQCECVAPMDWYCGACGKDWTFDPFGNIDQELSELTSIGCNCLPKQEFFCEVCKVYRDSTDMLWRKIKPTGTTTAPNMWSKYSYGQIQHNVSTYDNKLAQPTYFSDRHYNGQGLILPSGLKIYASSHDDSRKEGEFVPDWGLYLDRCWKPRWRHEYLHWPDMSVPSNDPIAVEAIIEAFERAQDGSTVEIGCIGGHGRTGTVLAAMAVLEGLAPDEAISMVRSDYCTKAIETSAQEWWVHWFSHTLFQTPLKDKPKDHYGSYSGSSVKPALGTSCSNADHYIYWRSGDDKCPNKEKGICKFWVTDIASFEAGKISKWCEDSYTNWLKEKDDKKSRSKSGSIVVDGFVVPSYKKGDKHHNPKAKNGCECDTCRYRAAGGAAFLTADVNVVRAAQRDGTIIEFPITETFQPQPPNDSKNVKIGTVRGEYVYCGVHEGWVWERISNAPSHLTNVKKKKKKSKNRRGR